jgi:anti-sigma factor RsiW
MRCHHVQNKLSAYQDGEIVGTEREWIAAHLEGCPACRIAYAELEQAWQSLEMIPEIQASPGFNQRLLERINTVPEPRSRWRLAWPSWIYRAYSVPAMAVLLLLVGALLGGYLGNAVMSGFSSAPAEMQVSRADTDIVSFRAFAAAPPGSLGDSYLRLAAFEEGHQK